jgi:hypothetical protein
VFAFVVYAVAIWFAAAKWRRQWRSFAWVIAGGIGLCLIALFHYQLNIWTGGRIYLRVLQVLLYPYTVLVVGMGLYIACLPRQIKATVPCPACEYDLAGLDLPGLLCPECGMSYEYAVARQIRGIHAGISVDLPAPEIPAVIPNPVSLEQAAKQPRPRAPAPAGPRWPAIAGHARFHHSMDE